MAYNFQEGEVLLIDKPLTWTSFDAVKKIRNLISHHTGIRKIKVGHAGTLDPLATGLLILCTGKATRRISEFMGMEKEYKGTLCLGATTASYDLETPIENEVPVTGISETILKDATAKFTGEIEQVPPAYSAINVDGKRAYRLAREKAELVLPARKVVIHHFNITAIHLPDVEFAVACSKGTYIRSLVDDYGRHLKCGAYLKSLIRTKIGQYSLDDAMSVAVFEKRLSGLEV